MDESLSACDPYENVAGASLTPATTRKLCHDRENPSAMMGPSRNGAAQRSRVAILGHFGWVGAMNSA